MIPSYLGVGKSELGNLPLVLDLSRTLKSAELLKEENASSLSFRCNFAGPKKRCLGLRLADRDNLPREVNPLRKSFSL